MTISVVFRDLSDGRALFYNPLVVGSLVPAIIAISSDPAFPEEESEINYDIDLDPRGSESTFYVRLNSTSGLLDASIGGYSVFDSLTILNDTDVQIDVGIGIQTDLFSDHALVFQNGAGESVEPALITLALDASWFTRDLSGQFGVRAFAWLGVNLLSTDKVIHNAVIGFLSGSQVSNAVVAEAYLSGDLSSVVDEAYLLSSQPDGSIVTDALLNSVSECPYAFQVDFYKQDSESNGGIVDVGSTAYRHGAVVQPVSLPDRSLPIGMLAAYAFIVDANVPLTEWSVRYVIDSVVRNSDLIVLFNGEPAISPEVSLESLPELSGTIQDGTEMTVIAAVPSQTTQIGDLSLSVGNQVHSAQILPLPIPSVSEKSFEVAYFESSIQLSVSSEEHPFYSDLGFFDEAYVRISWQEKPYALGISEIHINRIVDVDSKTFSVSLGEVRDPSFLVNLEDKRFESYYASFSTRLERSSGQKLFENEIGLLTPFVSVSGDSKQFYVDYQSLVNRLTVDIEEKRSSAGFGFIASLLEIVFLENKHFSSGSDTFNSQLYVDITGPMFGTVEVNWSFEYIPSVYEVHPSRYVLF